MMRGKYSGTYIRIYARDVHTRNGVLSNPRLSLELCSDESGNERFVTLHGMLFDDWMYAWADLMGVSRDEQLQEMDDISDRLDTWERKHDEEE